MGEVKELKEKDIVNYLADNWDRLFGGKLKFFRKEKQWNDSWRCDITAYVQMKLENHPNYRAPVFMECKFRSNGARDLILELEKAKAFMKTLALPSFLAVIMDDYSDETINAYLRENKVSTWLVAVCGNNINTLSVERYKL